MTVTTRVTKDFVRFGFAGSARVRMSTSLTQARPTDQQQKKHEAEQKLKVTPWIYLDSVPLSLSSFNQFLRIFKARIPFMFYSRIICPNFEMKYAGGRKCFERAPCQLKQLAGIEDDWRWNRR